MKHILLAAAILAIPTAAYAQQPEPPKFHFRDLTQQDVQIIGMGLDAVPLARTVTTPLIEKLNRQIQEQQPKPEVAKPDEGKIPHDKN